MGKTIKAKTRNTNVEVFRFLLLCSIFIWHLIVHGLGFKDIGSNDYPYNIHFTILAISFFCPAVDCFMFISGWYGIKCNIRKLALLISVSVLSAMLCTIINRTVSTGDEWGGYFGFVRNIYCDLFPISNKLWWFMSAYIMVFLVSPFINFGFENLPKEKITFVLLTMTAISIFSLPMNINWGQTFFGLLYVYIIGRFMKTYHRDIQVEKSVVAFISAFVIICIIEEVLNSFVNNKEYMWAFLQYGNPLILIEAISAFYIVINIPAHSNNIINKILSPCLCLYLIPELIKPYKDIVNAFSKSCASGILILASCIVGCLLIGQLIFFVSRKIANLLPKT